MVSVVFILRSNLRYVLRALLLVSLLALLLLFLTAVRDSPADPPTCSSPPCTQSTTPTLPYVVVTQGDALDLTRFSPYASISLSRRDGTALLSPPRLTTTTLETANLAQGFYVLDLVAADASVHTILFLVLPGQ
jgi:hypothetical protein